MKTIFKRLLSLTLVAATLFVLCAAVIPASANDYFRHPVSATYKTYVSKPGYANGEITIKVNAWINTYDCPMEAVMYWANGDGLLEGYESFARFSLSTISTTFKFPTGLIIPEGADRIRVYTAQKGSSTLSEQYVDARIPRDSAFVVDSDPLMTFAIVSDTHVQNSDASKGTVNFKNMLRDLKTNFSDLSGMFIVGDMISSSQSSTTVAVDEYAKLWAVRDEEFAGLPIYMAVGNHDLWPAGYKADTLQTMKELFYKNAVLPDGSHPTALHYDFWIDNCHFIFPGDDDMDGNYATLSADTLDWLDTTIATGYGQERQ